MGKDGNNQMDENDLEMADTGPVVKEFITSPAVKRKSGSKPKGFWELYGTQMAAGVFVLFFILAIVLGLFFYKLPVLTVILIILIETVLAILLRDASLWCHALILLVSIVAGVVYQMALFTIFGAVVYVAGVFFLHYLLGH